MSYKIGQLRRNQISSYQKEIPVYKNMIITNHNTHLTEDITVSDMAIVLSKELEKDTNYYISFIAQVPYNSYSQTYSSQTIELTLVGEGKEMPIKSFYIAPVPAPEGIFCEAVFTPNDTVYSKIVFKKKRTSPNDTSNAKLVTEYEKLEGNKEKCLTMNLQQLTNVINTYLKPKYSLNYLKQMGLQGPPGLMFCMNGEEIRIGKTGIYEVEGVSISNLAFVIKNQSPIPYADNLDYFIMDFYY